MTAAHPTIRRNGPCPCGSAKKYKVCCLPADDTSPPLDGAALAAMRDKALERLIEFGRRPQFKRAVQTAYETFWSRSFRFRDDDEQRRLVDHPVAEHNLILYMLLDAPARRDATIVDLFLAQQGRHLPPAEAQHLTALASSYVTLLRVDAISADASLTCTEIASEAKIALDAPDIDAKFDPGTFVALRRSRDSNGTTDHVGGTYAFSAAQGSAVAEILRTESAAQRAADPTLNETQFLKRHAAPLINHYWTDHVVDEEDDEDEPRRFDYPNERVRELALFLESDDAPSAMTIDEVHGFLCALHCGPELVPAAVWLPHVWGDAPPQLNDQAFFGRMSAAVIHMLGDIAEAFRENAFTPLLPLERTAEMANVAEVWCRGFLEALEFAPRAWAPFLADDAAKALIRPIRALAAGAGIDEASDVEDQSTAALVLELRTAVTAMYEYWREEREDTPEPPAPLRSANTIRRVVAVRRRRE